MVVDFSFLLSAKTIFAAAIVIALITIIFNRIIKRKERDIKDYIEETDPYTIFKKEIENLRSSDLSNENIILDLGRMGKELFYILYEIEKNKSYFESSIILKKMDLDLASEIAESMSKMNYSGNDLDKSEVSELINKFDQLIESEKIKLQRKQPFGQKLTLSIAKEIH